MTVDDAVTDPPHLHYVPGLDGLRGLAVAAVVAFHAGHLQGGYLGVDLFFVLSGYLITSLLLIEGNGGNISLVRFWTRRARRLLPALAVMLVGVALYAKVFAEPTELHRIRWDGLATLAYVANWREVFTDTDYWNLFTAPSPLAHTWSLAIEEQFYLIWPLTLVVIIVWLRRRRRSSSLGRVVTLTSAILAMASLVWSAFCEWQWGWNRVYYGTDTRAVALLLGSTVAGLVVWRGPVRSGTPRRVLEVAGMVGAAGLLVAWRGLEGGSWVARHGGLAAWSLAAALVIAAVSHPDRGPLSRLVSWGPLRRLGLISYGVYLYHWPIMVAVDAQRTGLDGWILLTVQVLLTLAVAVVSYRVIEQPVRHGATFGRVKDLGVLAGSFVLVTLLLISGTVGYQTPEAATAQAPSETRPGEPNGPRIMVTGNSVAWYLARDGIPHLVSDPQFAVLNRSRWGCSYPGSDSVKAPNGTILTKFFKSCNHGWHDAARSFRPDLVLYARDGFVPVAIHHDGRYLEICSSDFQDWYAALLERDARAYSRIGAKLVLVTSIPKDFHVWRTETPDGLDATVACGNDVLRRVARSMPNKVTLVDLHAHLCPDPHHCRDELNGQPLRPDGVHFRGRQAQTIAQWILAQVGIETRIAK